MTVYACIVNLVLRVVWQILSIQNLYHRIVRNVTYISIVSLIVNYKSYCQTRVNKQAPIQKLYAFSCLSSLFIRVSIHQHSTCIYQYKGEIVKNAMDALMFSHVCFEILIRGSNTMLIHISAHVVLYLSQRWRPGTQRTQWAMYDKKLPTNASC